MGRWCENDWLMLIYAQISLMEFWQAGSIIHWFDAFKIISISDLREKLYFRWSMNTRKYRKILYRYWKGSWIYLKLLVSITDKTFGSTEQTHLSSSYKIFWGWKTWKQILDPFQSHYCTDSTVTMSRFDIKYGFTKVCKELHEFKNTFAFRNCFIFLNLEWINCTIPLE